jgi:hypothetical protein
MVMNAVAAPPKSATAPGFLPYYWENFLLCVLMNLILPLVPLAFEWAFTDGLRFSSLLLAASFFVTSLGVSSFSRLYFGLSFLSGLALAAGYGSVASKQLSTSAFDLTQRQVRWTYLVLGVMTFAHLVERYMRHVQQRKPFLEFFRGED